MNKIFYLILAIFYNFTLIAALNSNDLIQLRQDLQGIIEKAQSSFTTPCVFKTAALGAGLYLAKPCKKNWGNNYNTVWKIGSVGYQVPVATGYLRQVKADNAVLSQLLVQMLNKLQYFNCSQQVRKQINLILNKVEEGPSVHWASNVVLGLTHSSLLAKCLWDENYRKNKDKCMICDSLSKSLALFSAPTIGLLIQNYFHKEQQKKFIAELRQECLLLVKMLENS